MIKIVKPFIRMARTCFVITGFATDCANLNSKLSTNLIINTMNKSDSSDNTQTEREMVVLPESIKPFLQ